MRVSIPCPSCGMKYRVSGNVAGTRVRCRICRSEFDISTEELAGLSGSQSVSARPRLLVGAASVIALIVIASMLVWNPPGDAGNGEPPPPDADEVPGMAALPPDAVQEKARLESVFEVIAKRYPCEIAKHPNTMIPRLHWFQFAEKIGTVDESVEIPIPKDVVRVWPLFDNLRIYGRGLDGRGIRVSLIGPAGSSEFQYWRDGDRMLAGHSRRLNVDVDNPPGHKLVFNGSGRIDRLVLSSTHGVSREFDTNPWSTLGHNQPIRPVHVAVDATRYRSIDGHCELERDRFWRIAAEYGTHPDAQIGAKFAVERGFYPGRMILKLDGLERWGFDGRVLREDAQRPGHPDYSIFENVQPRTDEIEQLRRAFGAEFEYGNCFDNWPSFMALKNTRIPNTRGTPRDFQSAAELSSRVIEAQKISMGRTARWWEVKNEATISQEWVLHAEPDRDGWSELSTFHNVMADTIHRDHPEVQVGGPSSAWMALHHDDFGLARKQLQFMDRTRDHLDFYSHHFYEKKDLLLNAGTEYSPGYLTGRLEGCLDLIRSHGHLTDNVKPLLITEYGTLYGGETDLHQWVNIKNYNGYLIRFMNQADAIRLTNAFVIPVKHWDRTARDGLFRYDDDGKLVLNKICYFLDFWKDYRGNRIPGRCLTDDVFVPMHCVTEGRTIQIAIHNLNAFRIKASIDLKIGDSQIESIEQTRLFFDKAQLVFKTTPVSSLDGLPVAVEETTLVKVTLDRPITPTQTLDEKTWFADKILQRTGKPITFQIDCDTESLCRSTLRICASRNGGFRRPMKLRVNGETIAESIAITPETKTGNYWGFVEVDIPAQRIRPSNAIEVTLSETGGHVTSVVMVNQQERSRPNP